MAPVDDTVTTPFQSQVPSPLQVVTPGQPLTSMTLVFASDTCPRPKVRTTTSSRNAAPLTTHETEKSALTDVSLSPVARVTHGFHPRAAGTHDGGPPTDASPSQPDTKKCIQVGRETYAVTSQPGTSSPFDTGIDTATCGAIVGRETIAPPLIGTSQVQRLQPVTNPTEHTNQNTLLITQPETPNTHHVEESIVFYDSSQTTKRRMSSGTRKRMKLHPP